jgi:hypothetical protein
MAMTILQYSRVISAWKPVDLSTLTDPSTMDRKEVDKFNEWVLKKAPHFLRNKRLEWKGPHLTNKMGPMGRA